MPNTDLPIPARMTARPRNKAGYVVPWFVADVRGPDEPDPVWDFRVIRVDGIRQAYAEQLCWLCGQTRGRYSSFVIGPMCAINRVSAEPPSHLECAEYAARVCPFLANPGMVRRTKGVPEEATNPGGVMLTRNPGVALVWTTRKFSPFRANGGVLFDVGDPDSVSWWAHGRPATRDEVLESIDTGLPALTGVAEEEGPGAVRELEKMTAAAMPLLPGQ